MTVTADIADLVGGPALVAMTTEQTEALAQHLQGQKSKYGGVNTPMDISGLHAGVTVGWLAQAFRMNPQTVKSRLAKCPTLKAHQRGYIYEFRVAVEYLVTPKVDIEEYLKNVKVKELPTRLQAEYWQAMRARQIWEKEAGHLWATEDVLSRFSEVVGLMRSELQLWVDNLEQRIPVSHEQREYFEQQVHTLQSTLYEKLIALPQQGRTLPSSNEDHGESPVPEDDGAELI